MNVVNQGNLVVWGQFQVPPTFACEAHGHRFTFHPSGEGRLSALLMLIAEAQESLFLAFYIFSRDHVGKMVRDALTDAAKRGVQVSVILDGFGAEADEAFFAETIAAGGRFGSFMAKWSRRALIRNHQKIVLADGHKAMLGGFNIEKSYFAPPNADGWNDLGLTVEGPVVARIAEWTRELEGWMGDEGAQWRDISRRVQAWQPGHGPVRLLIGGPTRRSSSWTRSLWRDLRDARRVDIMTAYFAPGRNLRILLGRVARRGGLKLLLAGRTDNGATIGAARAHYGELLASGARIREFEVCRLHAKLLVVDDAVYLGSANLDLRSLHVNLEIMLRIEDEALAERMREHIRAHYIGARVITPALHRRRATWFNRLRWRLSWLLVSVLDYTVARRLNLGQ